MTTMTRQEAIEEFGMYVSDNVASFPHLEYINSLEFLFGHVCVRLVDPDLSVKQIFGKFAGKPKNKEGMFDDLIQRYFFEEKSNVNELLMNIEFRKMVMDAMVAHAVKLHRKDFLKNIFSLHKSDKELSDFYRNNGLLDRYVRSLSIEIDYLPVEVQKSSLVIGDKIYRVFDEDIVEKGVRIGMYKITQKSLQENTKGQEPYFTAVGDNENFFQFFHTDSAGFSDYLEATDMSTKVFLKKVDAENYCAKIWSQVESNRQQYFRNNPKMK